MKRFLATILVIVISATSLFSCAPDGQTPDNGKTDTYGVGACDYAKERDTVGRIVTYVEMCIYNYGKVVFCLDHTAAPASVAQFVGLANGGYYSNPPEGSTNVYGNRIHAIKPGAYIHGGCHAGDGSGTLNQKIHGEFLDNGFKSNDISHRRGVISFAREDDYDSASCQFFICYTDMTELDGHYAAFGYVVEGMSVIDAIMNDLSQYANSESYVLTEEYQPKIKYVRLYEEWYLERGQFM
ncbi:MAG: peptidylprolyl isomerase [Clostridia bacterium]|nr:peptidylprolyl isomerase [Clostridia bacterium]